MRDMKRLVALVLAMAMIISVIAGCATAPAETPSPTEPAASTPATGAPAEKGTVKLAYVNWAEGIAMTNLAEVILEDEMGYQVETTMADVAPIFTSLAKGDSDAFMDTWLPVTHKEYIETYGDDMENLGANFDNALIGLVVPANAEINSIEELNDYVDDFDGKIIGIDSGAGIMAAAERAIEEYGLDYELINGSDPTMTAALKKAIDADEAVVVTGWKPHWKFARWDLKVLEDPKAIFGEAETIYTMARKGLSEDMPEVAAFLKNFKMTDAELGDLMGAITDNEDKEPIEVARAWAGENQELVQSWIPAE